MVYRDLCLSTTDCFENLYLEPFGETRISILPWFSSFWSLAPPLFVFDIFEIVFTPVFIMQKLVATAYSFVVARTVDDECFLVCSNNFILVALFF